MGPGDCVSLKSWAYSVQDRQWLETLWRRPHFHLSSAQWVAWLWHPWIGLQSPCGENHVKFVLGFPSSWSDSTMHRQCCGCRCRSCRRSFPSLTLRNWGTERTMCDSHTLPAHPRGPASPCCASLGVFQLCPRPASWLLWGWGRGLIFVAAFFFFFKEGKKCEADHKVNTLILGFQSWLGFLRLGGILSPSSCCTS